jgi:hypothetical protein
LNNKVVKKSFNETAKILEYIIQNIDVFKKLETKKITNHKRSFNILEKEITSIPISATKTSISQFVYTINDAISHKDMRKLRATQITSWLEQNGFLQTIGSQENGFYKIATRSGNNIGIETDLKKNSIGKDYATNMYDSSAQEFILENINKIVTDK